MKTRFLNAHDTTAYRSLRLYSLTESPFAFSDSYEDQAGKQLDDYAAEITCWGEPLECFTLGVFSGSDEMVGYIKFKRDQRSKARHRAGLYSLYVRPEYRGKGFAALLMTESLRIVETIPGIEQIQLSSIVSHVSLLAFYEKFGFEKLGGLLKNDLVIDGKYVDAWYMVKHLKRSHE